MNLSVGATTSDAPAVQIWLINCRDNAHKFFYDDLKPSKVGQGDLFLVV